MKFDGLRKKSGLTQKDIADKIGVDQSTIAKWETGAAMPRAEKLPKIAEALGCKIEDLFG